MVTIKDVATDAGVSVGTVSNVINGGKVSAKRKQKVEESITRLGYRTGTAVKTICQRNTDYCVVILPNLSNPFFTNLLQSLEKALEKHHMKPVLCISDRNTEKEKMFIDMASQNCVGGIIGITYSQIDEYVGDALPFIALDRHFSRGVTCVSSDNYQGGRIAAQRLLEGGSHNLLFLQVISSVENEVRKRRKGFEDYCIENGIPYSCMEFSEQQVQSIYSSFSSASLISRVLASCIDERDGVTGIDGIFTGTDHLAYVVCDALKSIGKRVPDDTQVIGFDGLRVLNTGDPYVSSIEQNTDLIAETAVNCLLRKKRGEPVDSVTDLPVRFLEGGTTRKIPDSGQ